MKKLPKIIGLVLCGGESSRMKADKSRIKYHQLEQRYFMYSLLQSLGFETYISCSAEQSKTLENNYNFIIDNAYFSGHGPVSGVISAFQEHPGKSIFVVGCDYPLLRFGDLNKLYKNRKNGIEAVCYRKPKQKLAEPLIAIYESRCHQKLIRDFEEEIFSLRRFLSKRKTLMILPDSAESLESVDTREALLAIKKKIRIIKNNIRASADESK